MIPEQLKNDLIGFANKLKEIDITKTVDKHQAEEYKVFKDFVKYLSDSVSHDITGLSEKADIEEMALLGFLVEFSKELSYQFSDGNYTYEMIRNLDIALDKIGIRMGKMIEIVLTENYENLGTSWIYMGEIYKIYHEVIQSCNHLFNHRS